MALTVLDAGVVIAVLDANDAHHVAARAALREASSDALFLPASAYAEVLVAPLRRGDGAEAVGHFLDAVPISIHDASRDIARQAAELRAAHGQSLRLPDALVLATAMVLGADRVITTDTRWPQLPVEVEVLQKAS
ncbi:MAG TPA: PIN domain-containing protein [Candidatus Limnocylindrales bacterium]|jgi:predicted nucleic acid-binding protein|nr:PIN domain-containing protein [Candidatus Limnocylindrales bacterium]